MMDQGSYQRLHKLLEERARSAMDEGDFGLAGHCARAAGELERWHHDGQQGETPTEVGELLGAEVVALCQLEITQLHRQAEEDRRRGNLAQAEATLQLIAVIAEDPAVPGQARADLEQLHKERRKAFVAATTAARQVRVSHPDDAIAQRTAWQTVLKVEPGSQEAKKELLMLDALIDVNGFHVALAEYRRPLVTRDIREVDQARWRVLHLLEQVSAPDLAQEAQATLDDLNELRNFIHHFCDGAVSYERAGMYEQAIAIYRRAIINEKLAWILDDRTGNYIEPSVALQRVRHECFVKWSERASELYYAAGEALKVGQPDIAVGKLEEALSLLEKVEEGGEEIRKRVVTLLEQARDQKKCRDRANELVLMAVSSDDPLVTRTLLVQAKLAYAAYPGIESMIQASDDLILRKPIRDLGAKMDEALTLLAALQVSVNELNRRLASEQ